MIVISGCPQVSPAFSGPSTAGLLWAVSPRISFSWLRFASQIVPANGSIFANCNGLSDREGRTCNSIFSISLISYISWLALFPWGNSCIEKSSPWYRTNGFGLLFFASFHFLREDISGHNRSLKSLMTQVDGDRWKSSLDFRPASDLLAFVRYPSTPSTGPPLDFFILSQLGYASSAIILTGYDRSAPSFLRLKIIDPSRIASWNRQLPFSRQVPQGDFQNLCPLIELIQFFVLDPYFGIASAGLKAENGSCFL